jgi:hypothetical protein
MTEDERASREARKAAEIEETKRVAAKSRRLHQLLHKDDKIDFLQALGLLKKD